MYLLKNVLLLFGIFTLSAGQKGAAEEIYVWNGTDQVLIPEESEITPEIFYKYQRKGLLDDFHFLPGAAAPLTKKQIEDILNEILSADPFEHEFYTIKDFPDKKFPPDNPADVFNPLTCLCTDIQPQTYLNENADLGPIEKSVGLEDFPESCLEAEQMGLCSNSTFMLETMPVVVPEGFCERSCGRCVCCESLLTLVESYSDLTLFAELVEITGMSDMLASTATEATVLAPSDVALQQALDSLGISTENLEENRDLLREILLFHVLPIHPYFKALWTTPFFVEGVTSDTFLSLQDPSIPPLSFRTTEENETFVIGPENSALIEEGDIEACKGYLNIIDTVLLPKNLGSAITTTPTIQEQEAEESLPLVTEVEVSPPPVVFPSPPPPPPSPLCPWPPPIPPQEKKKKKKKKRMIEITIITGITQRLIYDQVILNSIFKNSSSNKMNRKKSALKQLKKFQV
eukprot:TRINITY_DN1866_c0_g1_i1.p1 TRINITY_DN1866_c0_g1~~TRINITY_DN1866_c0_g1_i1.p1  ORF type:complete len:459 (-),score=95.78 TRINITY_DN1866_c0_g1_i1:387-1763(-)